MTEPRAGSRRYVHCMPASDRTASNLLPATTKLAMTELGCQTLDSPSNIGLESTTITEKSRPEAWASSRTFSTTDDLKAWIRTEHWARPQNSVPGVCQNYIAILDLVACCLLDDLVCDDDPLPYIRINFPKQYILCLKPKHLVHVSLKRGSPISVRSSAA